MTSSTVAWLAPLLAGCSLVYNPNNLPDPAIDAAVDAAPTPPVDANPSMLSVADLSPSMIEEGQGDFGSAPALVVVHGANIVNNNLKVELVAPEGIAVQLAPITDAVASRDASYLAFTVTAHVDAALTSDVPLVVRVTQDVAGGGTVVRDAATPLTLRGLPELTSSSLDGNPLTTTLPAPRYSMVDLSDVDVRVRGDVRAEISAVSSIKLAKLIADADGQTAGPDGYDGGMTPGGGPGGGGLGGNISGLGLASGGGGGGAGYARNGVAGKAGSGIGPGAGGGQGAQCGDDLLVGLASNRASAGGAGSAGNLVGAAPGGPGGGGGGTVVLDAGGDIAATLVSARGGNGTSRDSSGGGGGGGGAGGTVLATTLNGKVSIAAVDVAGGGGGTPNGGAGSVGRVRWDSPSDAAPSVAGGVRGPAFVVANRVFTSARPQLALVGTANRTFDVRVIDQTSASRDGERASFGPTGGATISPQLQPGHNRVCAVLVNGERGTTTGERCIDVAYLPE